MAWPSQRCILLKPLGFLVVGGCISLPPPPDPPPPQHPVFGTTVLVGEGGDTPRLTATLRGGLRAGPAEAGLEVGTLFQGVHDCAESEGGDTQADIARSCLLAGVQPQAYVAYDLVEGPLHWTFDAYAGGVWLWPVGEPEASDESAFLLTSAIGTRLAYPIGDLFGGTFEVGAEVRWQNMIYPHGIYWLFPASFWAGGLYLGAVVFE